MADFTRRQNTDTWQTRFARIANQTDGLTRQLDRPGQSLDELIANKNDLEQWLTNSARELRLIFADPSISSEFAIPIADLILAHINHAQAVDVLKEIIEDRLRLLDAIAKHTRLQEGR